MTIDIVYIWLANPVLLVMPFIIGGKYRMWLVKMWRRSVATGIFVIFYLAFTYWIQVYFLPGFSAAWEGEDFDPMTLQEVLWHGTPFGLMGLQIACLAVVVFQSNKELVPFAKMMAILLTIGGLFLGAVTCVVFLALFYYLKYDISRRHADQENVG